ncbi:hypothetical protein [Halorarius litoreus]|nr:hypothetical protein [Halorarius litoreus]
MPVESITIRCECGAATEVDPDIDRFECDCGSVYILTVTQLKPLLD